ncbi:MAG: non-homologous end-joining DNA ligase [Syntrophothermus sp.]
MQVGSRTLTLSNLEKLYWPDQGLTKAHLLNYYNAVAGYLLPFLHDRALTVVRYPNGIQGKFFYQKNAPAHAPEWIQTFRIPSEDAEGGFINYCLANDKATLLWFVNQAALELHPSHYRVDRVDRPDWAIVDLDPAAPADYRDAVEVAFAVKALLDHAGLESFPKTSGATGLHIYIPLARRHTFKEVTDWVAGLGRQIVATMPQKATNKRRVAERTGHVYIDHLQNLSSRTIVAPYSVRPLPGAPVSTPVTWDELHTVDPAGFNILTVPQRLGRVGDLFAPVLNNKQTLKPLPVLENV